jgi:hypothetical protein
MDPRVLRMAGIGVAVVAIGAGIYVFTKDKEQPIKEDLTDKHAAVARRLERAKPKEAPPPDLKVPLRAFDLEVLSFVSRTGAEGPMGQEDVLPRSPAKVSFMKENSPAGPRVARINIDLDRDRTIDETWYFGDEGLVQREVKFRGNYRDRYVLEGEHWKLVKGIGATALVQPGEKKVTAVQLRPLDKEVLALVKQGIKSPRQLDVTPGREYKVSLHRGRDSTVTRVDIDMDRDGMLDESWSIRGPVRRRVAPAGDGKFSEEYVLRDDQWVRQR